MIEDKETGAKIMSKEEKFWTEVKAKTERMLFETEQEIKLNKEVLKFAEKEIKKCM